MQHAPQRKAVDNALSIEELRARLRGALPEHQEVNADGSSYQQTIARYNARIRNPMTAIRAKCIECSGGSIKEANECTVSSCALHLFRLGKNPFHSKSKAHQQALAANEREADDGDAEE